MLIPYLGLRKTNKERLDVIQRKASRITCRAARDASAQPLMDELNLEDLKSRRKDRILAVTDKILSGLCHPALMYLISLQDDSEVRQLVERKPRTVIRNRGFSAIAPEVFNHSNPLSCHLSEVI